MRQLISWVPYLVIQLQRNVTGSHTSLLEEGRVRWEGGSREFCDFKLLRKHFENYLREEAKRVFRGRVLQAAGPARANARG